MSYLHSLKRIYRRLFKDVPKVKVKIEVPTERHGSEYGGWHIKTNSLNKNSIVYSVGIGKDVTFDQSIINKYNCRVIGYDPTPGLEKWIGDQNLDSLFKFIPQGLSIENRPIKFFKPKNKNNISHSSEKASHTDSDYVEVPCVTIHQMMKDNDHSKIDLLKMDIEGEELKVIDYILANNIKINQLLIEFHHFFSSSTPKVTEEYIRKLDRGGYKLFYVSDSFCEYSFIKS